MNTPRTEKRCQVVAALVEGNTIRATVRMTDVTEGTVLTLLADLGNACEEYQRRTLVNLKSKPIQCDEIWSFYYAKQKNVPAANRGQYGYGDVWTWTALDADSKLLVLWLIGEGDAGYAMEFMSDVASRLVTRIQLTTDGLKAYLEAVEWAFGSEIDSAQLVKLYGAAPEAEERYSPAECIGCERKAVTGFPDPRHVSTS